PVAAASSSLARRLVQVIAFRDCDDPFVKLRAILRIQTAAPCGSLARTAGSHRARLALLARTLPGCPARSPSARGFHVSRNDPEVARRHPASDTPPPGRNMAREARIARSRFYPVTIEYTPYPFIVLAGGLCLDPATSIVSAVGGAVSFTLVEYLVHRY